MLYVLARVVLTMTVAVAKRPIHMSRPMTTRWRKGRFILPMKTRSSTVSVKSATGNRGVGIEAVIYLDWRGVDPGSNPL